ncbi:M15 family metallopeptidase [Algicola sagamiensis]|uniref:M15 family metallopeptidase n=1 Tax=Algicola sagamiensis TaxID=163869 RepID=UPI0003722099|nr:M15 family metallopeptidase [Algicola sagamiensis]
MKLTQQIATGLTEQHLVPFEQVQVHKDVVQALRELIQAAKDAGFDLSIASAFRHFERQKFIWENKYQGHRPVYALDGQEVDIHSLEGWERCQAILLYSACPGGSRHHWGADFDIFDRSAVSDDYQLQLIESEYTQGGPFHPLSQWLKSHAAEFGFFFPYQQYQNGVAPEPWHISYRPLATEYLDTLDQNTLNSVFSMQNFSGKDVLKEYSAQLLQQFIRNICYE